jgi:hypothetical protein
MTDSGLWGDAALDQVARNLKTGCIQVESTVVHDTTHYRGHKGARQITAPFTRLPWIDPEFPQLSRRFAKVMAKRTAIERLHKLMKYDYGDERLTKRGNAAFQARLDKTLLAMHLVLAYG